MQKMSEWREGVYVRVYGALSEFEGNFRILAFNVRKVTDFNEVRSLSASKSQSSACRALLDAINMCEQTRLSLESYAAQVTYHNLQAIFQHAHLSKGGAGTGLLTNGVRCWPCTKPDWRNSCQQALSTWLAVGNVQQAAQGMSLGCTSKFSVNQSTA